MTPALSRLLVTAAIAFCCGLLGASMAGYIPNTSPVSGKQGDRLIQFRERIDHMLSDEMRLSPEQNRRVALIDHNYTLDYNLTLADLHASNAQLGAALANDMSLNPEAQTAIKEIQLNVGQMQTSTVNYIIDIRNVLTPDQKKVFDGRIIAELM